MEEGWPSRFTPIITNNPNPPCFPHRWVPSNGPHTALPLQESTIPRHNYVPQVFKVLISHYHHHHTRDPVCLYKPSQTCLYAPPPPYNTLPIRPPNQLLPANNPHRPPHLRQIPPSRPATNLPRRAHRLLQPPIPLPPPPHLRRNPVRLPHRLRPRPLLPPRPRPQRKRLRKGRPRLHLRRRQASPIPKRYRHPRWHELHQGVAVSAPL